MMSSRMGMAMATRRTTRRFFSRFLALTFAKAFSCAISCTKALITRMPLMDSCTWSVSSENASCFCRKRRCMCLPKKTLPITITIIGETAISVRRASTCSIMFHSTSTSMTDASKIVIPVMPSSLRTDIRSLVKCAIRSPVLCSL